MHHKRTSHKLKDDTLITRVLHIKVHACNRALVRQQDLGLAFADPWTQVPGVQGHVGNLRASTISVSSGEPAVLENERPSEATGRGS